MGSRKWDVGIHNNVDTLEWEMGPRDMGLKREFSFLKYPPPFSTVQPDCCSAKTAYHMHSLTQWLIGNEESAINAHEIRAQLTLPNVTRRCVVANLAFVSWFPPPPRPLAKWGSFAHAHTHSQQEREWKHTCLLMSAIVLPSKLPWRWTSS